MELLNEEDVMEFPPGTNPLLINTVVKCIFEFLKLEDLKNCRRVCHQWNFVANPILRKGTTIRFDSNHRPKDLATFSFRHCNLPDLPFTSYKFGYLSWPISEVQDFIAKWGSNVTSLKFLHGIWNFFNLSPLIHPLSSHLVELIADWTLITWGTLTAVPTLKILSLKNTRIKFSDNPSRIAPSKVSLVNNTFYENDRKLDSFIVNYLIDFSKCSEIQILGGKEGSNETKLTFEMAKDFINAKKIHFSNIRPLNWCSPNSKTEHFKLEDYEFKEKIVVNVKELEFINCRIDLTFLPNTIEKLSLDNINEDVKVSGSLHFPNLKYLKLCPQSMASYFDPYNVLPHFGNCLNLVDVELEGAAFLLNKNPVLNLRSFPQSVKRLKIIKPAMLDLIGDDNIFVDVLILDDCPYLLAQTIMTKIKPKVLVMTLTTLIIQDYEWCKILWESEPRDSDVDNFILFVRRNSRLEKIIVKLHDDFKNVIEESNLGKYVDQMAMYYEFQNQRGHAIAKVEFEKYSTLK